MNKLNKKIEKIVEDSRYLFDADKVKILRNDIEYAYFAYGFEPKEYVYFQLAEKDIRTFVSDTERRCVKHTMNDFTQPVFADKGKVYQYFRE